MRALPIPLLLLMLSIPTAALAEADEATDDPSQTARVPELDWRWGRFYLRGREVRFTVALNAAQRVPPAAELIRNGRMTQTRGAVFCLVGGSITAPGIAAFGLALRDTLDPALDDAGRRVREPLMFAVSTFLGIGITLSVIGIGQLFMGHERQLEGVRRYNRVFSPSVGLGLDDRGLTLRF